MQKSTQECHNWYFLTDDKSLGHVKHMVEVRKTHILVVKPHKKS
jgi:ribosomal 30S subunit maturation factor RimM